MHHCISFCRALLWIMWTINALTLKIICFKFKEKSLTHTYIFLKNIWSLSTEFDSLIKWVVWVNVAFQGLSADMWVQIKKKNNHSRNRNCFTQSKPYSSHYWQITPWNKKVGLFIKFQVEIILAELCVMQVVFSESQINLHHLTLIVDRLTVTTLNVHRGFKNGKVTFKKEYSSKWHFKTFSCLISQPNLP